MALVALASAKGSPGVSVAAVGLSAVWHRRAVVADLDPAGGDVALRYRDGASAPLDTETGLLSLAVAVRRGTDTDVQAHLQTTAAGMQVLVGVAAPSQVQGMGPAWPHMASSLRAAPDLDVLADCGRVTPGSPTLALLERADAVVMLTGSTLEDVAHLRERLSEIRDTLRLGAIDGVPVGVAVVAPAKDTRSAEDVHRLLESSNLSVRSLGTVAQDPKAAEALRTESGRGLRRSLLLRSLSDVAAGVRELVDSARAARQGAF